MKKAFFILASLAVVGCMATPIVAPSEHKEVTKPVQQVLESVQKTSIFYYYLDSVHPQSAISKVFFDYVFGIEYGGFNYTLDELFNPYRTKKALEQASYSTLGSAQSTNYSITINGLKQCNIDKK